ncbi:MAG: ROK family protein [Peptostreptococcaceae bacterium]
MYNIGIDVGGTSIKAGLVENGEITIRANKEVDITTGIEGIVEIIKNLVLEIVNQRNIKIDDISSIGIGIPGVVNNSGCVTCVNLNLKNAPVELKLKEEFPNIKISVENDANVAAFAEYKYGSMKGYDTALMLTLGTGVGAGIIINGKPFSGAHGIGSELGHVILDTNYYDCNCGNNGCFETFCSATAIIKYAQKLISEGNSSIILAKANNNIENIDAKIVFDAYKEEDEVAINVIKRFKEYLIRGIVSIAHFIDPEIISLGGGVSNASEIVLEGLEDELNKRIIYNGNGIAKIVIAQFKNDAGILGASAL